MAEVRWVAEVQGWVVGRESVECVTESVDLRGCARLAVDSFDLKAEDVDGLHALEDDHGYGRLIASEERVKGNAEHAVSRGCCWRRLSRDGGVGDRNGARGLLVSSRWGKGGFGGAFGGMSGVWWCGGMVVAEREGCLWLRSGVGSWSRLEG